MFEGEKETDFRTGISDLGNPSIGYLRIALGSRTLASAMTVNPDLARPLAAQGLRFAMATQRLRVRQKKSKPRIALRPGMTTPGIS